MNEHENSTITNKVLSLKNRRRYAGIFAFVAVIVAVTVAGILRQHGVAMTHTETVLDCQYSGNGAHTHTDDCYDEDGNLVCPLEEKEFHVHDDDCYEEEDVLVCGLEEDEIHGHTVDCLSEDSKLVCGLEETEGHTHDDDCYDEDDELICDLEETEGHVHTVDCYDGELVCGKQETEGHVHTDDCYDEDDELICGLEEGEIHGHTDDCYDENDELICDKFETEGHVHTDDCYETERKLVCDKEEVKEEHVHGPGCFKTIQVRNDAEDKDGAKSEDKDETEGEPSNEDKVQAEVDTIKAEAENGLPAQSFSQSVYNKDGEEIMRVSVEAPEGAFPEGTTMEVSRVKSSDVEGVVNDAMAAAGDKRDVDSMQAVDIVFRNADGDEIEPLCSISVSMSSNKIAEEETTPVLVHVNDEGKGEVVDQLSDDQAAERKLESGDDTIAFDSDAFSIYIIAYTVDFHYNANGKTYDFSIPGGGYVTLQQLVEVLGIAGGNATADEDVLDETVLTLADVEIGDKTKEFVAKVENVEFSTPELVWVGKVDADITVGELKEANELDCLYSSDLTDKQIAKINDSSLESGDWALISLLPFTSDESLTVTMENGDQWTVNVTDAQMTADVLTAAGENYRITVTYDDDAEIPEGTELVVREIEPGTDEYNQYLGRLSTVKNEKYYEVEEMREHYDDSMGELPDAHYINIHMARFFDITLVHDGKEIEPKAPVQVDIRYPKGLYTTDTMTPGVVHYVNDEDLELIEGVETNVSDNEVTSFHYEQDSFSVVCTFVEQQTQDILTGPLLAPGPGAAGGGSAGNVTLPTGTVEEIVASAGSGSDEESPSSNDNSSLVKPRGNKTLVANNDGTYTLTLSVTGHSSFTEQSTVKKSNILFVMDRSSSMIKKTVSNEETRWLYGTQNTSIFRPDLVNDNYHYKGIVNGEEVDLTVTASWDYTATITYTREAYWEGSYREGWTFHPEETVNYPPNAPIYVVSKKTRMKAEQEALGNLFSQLLNKNDASGENSDIVELSVICFGDQRFDLKTWKAETDTGNNWTDGRDPSALNNVVSSNRFTSGTNWEEGLQYAIEVISAKKAADEAAGKLNEDYYVVFLTDGEPTAKQGNEPNAVPYQGSQNYIAYDAAKDEAKKLVDDLKVKFYNIFTYRDPKSESENYSVYLTNYAYGNGDYNNDKNTNAVKNYFSDAKTPEDVVNALQNIVSHMENTIGHSNVSITDTLTTDAMTKTVVQGKTNGYVYEVKNSAGNVLYTVTATDNPDNPDNPTVLFKVGQNTYVADASVVGGKTYYSVTVEGKTYKMALADVNDATGELVWDLSPVGLLMDDCTYSVSFIVWPDQDAYDYVAALNNGLTSIKNSKNQTIAVAWDEANAVDSGKGYKTGGVADYPSIVKKTDGTFAVLTNTEQKVHYSVSETTSDGTNTNTTTHGPYCFDLPTPNPMPLTASKSQLEKIWHVDRDPGILAQLLYTYDGKIKKDKNGEGYHIDFSILQETEKYTDVRLGWHVDASYDEGGYYSWDENSVFTHTFTDRQNGATHDVTIGTRWVEDFSIATGLMLSTDRMDALGLDKTAYPSATFEGKTYYILEEGHDYTIEEPTLTYEFDFSAPVYHPMLVDGVLKNVNMTKTGTGANATYAISKIQAITVDNAGKSSLKVENTLRGYINLNKQVVDLDGVTPVTNDNTKFTYNFVLENASGPFTEEGEHVPWYGINGLYYHDDDYNYYQASPAGGNKVTLKDENGNIYQATSSEFNESVGPAPVTYTDGDGTEKTIRLHGNVMHHDSDNKVTATLKINQHQTLSISNVPSGSTYSVKEVSEEGYELVRIKREVTVKAGSAADPTDTFEKPSEEISSATITGTVVDNRNNNITYYNKSHVVDINIQKLDDNEHGLEGAVFQLKKVGADGYSESLPTVVGGLGTVEKEIQGQTVTYDCAFVSTGAKQTISRLSDGIYRLYELHAPDGYVSTFRYIQFEIKDRALKKSSVTTDTGGNTSLVHVTSASGSGETAELALLQIENVPGTPLPHTGGSGTTISTFFGAVLSFLAGAGIVVTRNYQRDAM